MRFPAPARWVPPAFVALFAALVASTSARNPDVWQHLADGRAVFTNARFTPNWMFDAVGDLIYSVGGGTLLVAAKAAAVVGMALLMLRAARGPGPVWLACGCVALGVLVAGSRMQLQPQVVSYLFLAALGVLLRDDAPAVRPKWVDWRLLALFWAWANTDVWFVLGLGVLALTWAGELFDRRSEAGAGVAVRRGVGLIAAVLVCLLTPLGTHGFRLPTELTPAVAEASGPPVVNSPFSGAFFATFTDNPSALAFLPLFAAGGLSFLGVVRGWRWSRFLPWAGLALVAAMQVRAAPFFAVFAGPVLAVNLQQYLAKLPARRPLGRVGRVAFVGLLGSAAAGVLVAAWPGWLVAPAYEPRRWAVEHPAGAESAAATVRGWRTSGLPAGGGRTLHPSADTRGQFAWFDPADDGFTDDPLVKLLTTADAKPADALRAAGVKRVVVWLGSRGPAADVLRRRLADPVQWPLLHATGGVAVFGWRDPARPGVDDFAALELDFDRIAFRPTDAERPTTTPPEEPRQWWHPFVRPAVARTPDRDEAYLLLARAEAESRTAAVRLDLRWKVGQAVALVGGAGTAFGPTAGLDVTVRMSEPSTQEEFNAAAGNADLATVLAGIRAARRATAVSPADASTHVVLGQLYLRLAYATAEAGWARRMPDLRRLRLVQASAALNRALRLNPDLTQPHLDLAQLYLEPEVNCGDLALTHFARYRELCKKEYRPPDPLASDEKVKPLADEVNRRRKAFDADYSNRPVADRAEAAERLGLGGLALQTLLDSEVSLFGADGVRRELDLLLRAGRPADVLAWSTPEFVKPVGASQYHWIRAQAHLAVGDYPAADAEFEEMRRAEPTLFGGTPRAKPPAAAAEEVTKVIAMGMLGQRPTESSFNAVSWRVATAGEYLNGLSEVTNAVARQNEVATFRGLAALEAGDIPAAVAHLEPLATYPDRSAAGVGPTLAKALLLRIRAAAK